MGLRQNLPNYLLWARCGGFAAHLAHRNEGSGGTQSLQTSLLAPEIGDRIKLILCSGCDNFDIDPRDLVGTWEHWHVVINHSQNYLGKVMLVLRRHATDVTNLTVPEQLELWTLLSQVKTALASSFQPDHFNYAFLMNQ